MTPVLGLWTPSTAAIGYEVIPRKRERILVIDRLSALSSDYLGYAGLNLISCIKRARPRPAADLSPMKNQTYDSSPLLEWFDLDDIKGQILLGIVLLLFVIWLFWKIWRDQKRGFIVCEIL